jgi:hypothetical protein
MEEHPSEAGELPEPPNDGGSGLTGAPVPEPPRPNPVAEALAAEAEEIRRLVEGGAGSPEAIRELAARLRAHREREEALWRSEVRPALVKEGKGRFRARSTPASSAAPEPAASPGSQSLWLGVALLGLVLIVVLAASTTVWLLILPVLALLVWAWKQGQDSPPGA